MKPNDEILAEDLNEIVNLIEDGGPGYIKLVSFLDAITQTEKAKPETVYRVKDSVRCLADIARTLNYKLPKGRLRE